MGRLDIASEGLPLLVESIGGASPLRGLLRLGGSSQGGRRRYRLYLASFPSRDAARLVSVFATVKGTTSLRVPRRVAQPDGVSGGPRGSSRSRRVRASRPATQGGELRNKESEGPASYRGRAAGLGGVAANKCRRIAQVSWQT